MTNCKQCGKPKKAPKQFNYVSRATWEADEFCSRKCAEKHYGVVHKPGSTAMDYGVVA